MNIFKTINAIVQSIARFIAFALGLVLTIIVWIIGRINAFVMVAIGLCVWALYKIALVFNKLTTWLRWLPEKIAVHCFLFALDISPAEHKAQIAELEAALEQDRKLKEMTARLKEDLAQQDAEEVKNDPS